MLKRSFTSDTYSWLSAFKSSERWALSRISLSSTAPSLDPPELSLFWGTPRTRRKSSSADTRSLALSSAMSTILSVDGTSGTDTGKSLETAVGRSDTGSVGAESVTEVGAACGVFIGVTSVSSSIAVTNVRLLDILLVISSLNLSTSYQYDNSMYYSWWHKKEPVITVSWHCTPAWCYSGTFLAKCLVLCTTRIIDVQSSSDTTSSNADQFKILSRWVSAVRAGFPPQINLPLKLMGD